MTRSAEDIERDAEGARAGLDRTVGALAEKMTPSSIASEVMGSIRNGPVGARAIQLRDQAKDNSVPLALMGAGLAWLMINRNRSSHYETRSYRPARAYGSDADYDTDNGYLGEYDSGGADGVRRKVSNAVRDGADRTRQAVSSAKDSLSSTASNAKERARTVADGARRRAVDYGHRAEETFMDTLEREPLIIGALGVAVGAAVGLALPSTPIEDRYVGPLRDRALDEGKAKAKEGFEQAKGVATAAAQTLKDEADRQGVTDMSGLVDKAEQIARAGVDTVKREVETRRGH
jgi:hypothetical protein